MCLAITKLPHELVSLVFTCQSNDNIGVSGVKGILWAGKKYVSGIYQKLYPLRLWTILDPCGKNGIFSVPNMASS